MGITRVSKKLVPALWDIDAAIIMCNAYDPQLATLAIFYSAIEDLSHFTVLNKTDMVDGARILELTKSLPGEVIPSSLVKGRGVDEIKYRLGQWHKGTKVAVLGVFNCLSGDTEIIAKSSKDKHGYSKYTLRELGKEGQGKRKGWRSLTTLSYISNTDEIVISNSQLFSSGEKQVYRIILEDERFIDVTEEHKLFVLDRSNIREKTFSELRVGDTIATESPENMCDWLTPIRGRGDYTKGALAQMKKRMVRRNLDGLATYASQISKRNQSMKKKLEICPALKEYYRNHMRSVQALSPKGSNRKGRTFESYYGEERSLAIKQKLSVAFSGEKNPSYGKVRYPKAYYVDYLGHSVRSSWEENICRFLQMNHIAYQYEPETIKLEVNGKHLSYTPDIKVDGYYIEVKGPIYDWQIEKLKAFVKTGRKLILITNNRRTINEKVQGAFTHHVFYGDYDKLLALIKHDSGDCIHPIKIVDIQRLGMIDTYDIHVPRYENFFLANGILSHNSGKTTLINALTGGNNLVDDIPGTTLEFSLHDYNGIILVDSVGQLIDVSKPLMVSMDFTGCTTVEERIIKCFDSSIEALLASKGIVTNPIVKAVDMIIDVVDKGGKLITCGAGASGLVAKEIGGQAQETGLPVMVFTNDFAFAQPVSFAKGAFEDEYSLAEYFGRAVNERDCVLGVSASGGTGFVFELLAIARGKGAKTIAITENSDTPLGKNADIIIKSDSKPEGPSSSRVMVAHLVIGYSLILTIADMRGVNAEQAIGYMMPQRCRNKRMGIK